MKRLALLGSTGSIGRQTLEVVATFPEKLQIVALAAGSNLSLLEEQARQFRPRFVYYEAAHLLPAIAAEFLSLEEMASHPEIDLLVVATSGKAGLLPTLAALKAGKSVALANKEALVMAGELVTAAARQAGVTLLPVDSEHSALWQCLRGEEGNQTVARLILTASGGPFRDFAPTELSRVTPEEALRHPTWRMGRKVTIDSATLMNKGMETIEARWLFDVPLERIEVVLHPESLIHSLVEFADGSCKAQLSFPDMRLPIQYALSYPERWANPALPRLFWERPLACHFQPLAEGRFPCLHLAREAGKKGGTFPAVLCAADEVAVGRFLEGKIGFLDIPRLIEEVLGQHRGVAKPSLEEILTADAWAREQALAWSNK